MKFSLPLNDRGEVKTVMEMYFGNLALPRDKIQDSVYAGGQ